MEIKHGSILISLMIRQKYIESKKSVCLYEYSQNGLQMIEFGTKIEFDNFSLEMVDFDFFVKVMQSKNLKVKVEDNDINTSKYIINVSE